MQNTSVIVEAQLLNDCLYAFQCYAESQRKGRIKNL
jgi:hypothetical protein